MIRKVCIDINIIYVILRAKRLGSVRRSIDQACERHEI